MKYKTVRALCDGIADAIKEKEGSTALINPQDFVDRIKGLEVGGASGSKWRYFKKLHNLPSAGGGDVAIYSLMSQIIRSEVDGKAIIMSGCFNTTVLGYMPIAYGCNLDMVIVDTRGEMKTLGESLAGNYDDPYYFEEITEEQFYDLNTLLSE